jgi:hypothetical protein
MHAGSMVAAGAHSIENAGRKAMGIINKKNSQIINGFFQHLCT